MILILILIFLWIIIGGGKLYNNKWRGIPMFNGLVFKKILPPKSSFLIGNSFREPRYCAEIKDISVTPNCELWYTASELTYFKFKNADSYFILRVEAGETLRVFGNLLYSYKCVADRAVAVRKFSTIVKKRVFTILDDDFLSADAVEAFNKLTPLGYAYAKENKQASDKMYIKYREFKKPPYNLTEAFVLGGTAPEGINLYYRDDRTLCKQLQYIFSKKNRTKFFGSDDVSRDIGQDYMPGLKSLEKGHILSFGVRAQDDFPIISNTIREIADEFGFGENWQAQVSKVNLIGGFKHHFDRINKFRKLLVFNIGDDIYYDMLPIFHPAKHPVRIHIPRSTIIEMTSDSRYLWTHGIPVLPYVMRYAIIIRQ